MKVDATLEIEFGGVSSDELEALLEIVASLPAKIITKRLTKPVSAARQRQLRAARRVLVRDLNRDVYAYPQNKICG